MPNVTCPKCTFANPEGRTTCARCSTPLKPSEGPPKPVAGQAGQTEFCPGQIVASRYTVLGMIGRGGMGCIYRVKDNALKEDVALKTLLPQFVRDKMVVERFFNEARIARALSHPNVVRVHDIGMTGNTIYISMELVRGKSLRTMIDSLPPGQRLPVRTTLDIIDQLCGALEYAHDYTVHRDIKPENVMLTGDGQVKLMDFGISKLMDTTRLTGTSVVMGTPFYMSPEQIKNSADVDARADIYSVGVVLYEILTGNVPSGVPKPASQLTRDVPPALDAIVAKCVDPDPDKRFRNAGELRAALRPILDAANARSQPQRAVSRKPTSTVIEAKGRAPGVRKLAGVVAMIVILAASGAAIHVIDRREPAVSAPHGRQTPMEAAPEPATPQDGSRAAEYARLDKLIKKAQSRAVNLRNSDRKPLLVKAKRRFDEMQMLRATGDKNPVETAWQVLQCYLAPTLIEPRMEAMVFVPPGRVAVDANNPGETVLLDGFFIDEKEVSWAEFAAFCEREQWRPIGRYEPDLPAANLPFYDAQAYAASRGATLPTEAQWARAAYGDTPVPLPWGEGWVGDEANTYGVDDGYDRTAPVGSFEETDRSWCGCLDMAGNVSEWTRSLDKPLPYDPADGREDPAGIYFGSVVVVRGGDYAIPSSAPLAQRGLARFEEYAPNRGFRCVIELPATVDDVEAILNQPAS
ncbi:MAG: SUMF1/EgtB/PvdO family nonheme iron enzyme [Nitrospiraceae bacterium]|nr:SUMF1/EgtB/PvdO family nonheme iron enzyme [Nitrospiraceae bacterium]